MTVESPNKLGMKLVLIPPGEFQMESSDAALEQAVKMATELRRPETAVQVIGEQESPQHRVLLHKPYLMSTTEVTNAEFNKFAAAVNYAPQAVRLQTREKDQSTWGVAGHQDLDRLPVVHVSWNDAAAFCNWLSAEHGLNAGYRQDALGGWSIIEDSNSYRLPTEAEWEMPAERGR